jgi:CheY-like chemotaxis protein
MIFVVDDEQVFLTLGRELLKQDGFEVETFERAADALDRLEVKDPDLIISDIMMPEMDGFAFKDEVTRRFPEKDIPFVFLSSLGDPEQLIRGLEADIDDYLVKPIESTVLKARVKSLLRRRKRSSEAVFQGDLGVFSFNDVVRFCEEQGFSGDVTFEADDWKVVIPFKGGAIQLDDLRRPNDDLKDLYDFDEIEDADDVLGRLYDLDHGRFTIKARGVDFSALERPRLVAERVSQSSTLQSKMPIGRLAGIKVGQRLFQVQTEMVFYPEKRIETVVVLNGNTVLKRSQVVEPESDMPDLDQLIDQQHQAIKAEVQKRVEELARAKSIEVDVKIDEFGTLFDAGFDAFRDGDFSKALEFWLEAQQLKPEDPMLENNLRIVRSRVGPV